MPNEAIVVNASNTTANLATGVSLGTGFGGYITANVDTITISIGVFSALVALLFYILNYRLNLKTHELNEIAFRKEMMAMVKAKTSNKLSSDELEHLFEVIGDMKSSRSNNRTELSSRK